MLGWWNIFDCSGGGRGCGEFLSGMECFSSAMFQFSCVAFSGESRVEGVCLLFFCFFFFSSVSKYIHEVARGNGGRAKSSCARYKYGMQCDAFR